MCRLLVCVLVALSPTALSAAPLTPPAPPAAQSIAQPEFRGRVLDPSGSPVARAHVRIQPENGGPVATILADGRGEFALPLPAGVYRLTVTAPGFEESQSRVTLGSGQERPVTDVVLSVAGFTETVNVDAPRSGRISAVDSATRTPTPLRDVPQAVSVVSRAQMADQRMSSMADVVRFMPGVSMGQGEGNRDTPILRGNSSTSDFFVDGVRDDVQYFRDVYNLERVEALKGPNAMIFGRGGGGGVINRVTRQAQWGQSQEVALQAGSFDDRRVTADFGTALNEFMAARVTGVYEDSGSYRSGVGIERLGVQPSVAFRLGPSTLLRASYEYFHDERTADRGIPSFDGRPLATDAGTFFGDPANSRSDATVNVFASVIEHEFGSHATLRNRVSYGVYDKFYQNVFPGAVNAAGTRVSISGYNNATDRRNFFNQTDFTLRQPTGGIQHTLLVGAELGRQATENFRSTARFPSLGSATSIEVPVTDPTISLPLTFQQSATDADNHGVATTAAIYVQDQMELTSRLQAVAGLRLDAFELDFTNNRTGLSLTSTDRLVSPRLGLIYKPIVPVSVYGSYSLSYLPRAGDQLSSLSLTNQSLEPEEFRNYELGVKWDASSSLGVTAAVYRLDRGNVAVPDPADPTRSLLVDAQRTRGLELEVSGSLANALNLTAGYAYQNGEITQAISSTSPAGADLAQLPAHAFSFWGRYDILPRWSGALGIVNRTDMFASTDNRVRIPGFTRVDAAVFFDVTSKLRAQLNVQNLFDIDYYASVHNNNNITPGSPRAVRVTLTTKF